MVLSGLRSMRFRCGETGAVWMDVMEDLMIDETLNTDVIFYLI